MMDGDQDKWKIEIEIKKSKKSHHTKIK